MEMQTGYANELLYLEVNHTPAFDLRLGNIAITYHNIFKKEKENSQ